VIADAKTAGRENLRFGGKKIALKTAKEFEAARGNVAAITKINSLIWIVNHDRSKDRPKHPMSLDFTPALQHFPEDFFLSDVKVDKQRHFIFAT